jgi:hypothetical protein
MNRVYERWQFVDKPQATFSPCFASISLKRKFHLKQCFEQFFFKEQRGILQDVPLGYPVCEQYGELCGGARGGQKTGVQDHAGTNAENAALH